MNAAFLENLAGSLTLPLRRRLRSFGLGSMQAWIPLGIMALLLALSAAMLRVGYQHAQEISRAYRQSVINQLEAISEFKKSELMQWRKERLGDARNLRDNPELSQAAARLLRNPADTAAREEVRRWLLLSYAAYGEYESIFLLDASGRRVLSTSPKLEASSMVLRDLLQARETERGVRFADFYRDEHDGQIYCAVAYTVFNDARKPLGHVVMRIRADAYIYPLIRKWPTSSKTGETIIVRREGQVVRYLTNLRKIESSGLGFTIPVERRDVLAVRAALGQHGTTQGLDFAGVPVVAALTTLPDNSWTLETKIDLAEIESGTSEQVQTIGLLLAALAACIILGSLVIWSMQRSVMAKNALEAENRLHRSQVQFGNLIETMAQGLVKVDALGTVTYTNSHFLAMLGRSHAEVVGQDISLHAADPGMRERLCALEAAANAEDSGYEMVWLNSAGAKVFSTVTPVFQPAAAGACAEKWLLVLDTTKRKHLESQLLQSQKLEAIGQLAAGIAHEINTPAQYVGNNVKFIKDAFGEMLAVCGKVRELVLAARDAPPTGGDMAALEAFMDERDISYLEAEVPGAIAQTLEGVERISTIVRSVKQFAHPASAAMSSADLNEAMLSTVTVSRNEWKYVAELETDLDPDLPLVVCMVGEINQVVLNLIVNAAHAIADVLKADPERKGRITLSTRLAPPWAEIRVTDTGPGIPPEVQAKIFDPFFTTKEVGKGTGQGLTISRTIVVEKHRGQLFFETEPGVGTTFVVRLPLEHAEEPEQ